jgi:hypothetical protein
MLERARIRRVPQLAQPVHLGNDRLLLFDVKGALELRCELIGGSARPHDRGMKEHGKATEIRLTKISGIVCLNPKNPIRNVPDCTVHLKIAITAERYNFGRLLKAVL